MFVCVCWFDSDDDEEELYKNVDDAFDDDYEDVYGSLVEYTKKVITVKSMTRDHRESAYQN